MNHDKTQWARECMSESIIECMRKSSGVANLCDRLRAALLRSISDQNLAGEGDGEIERE